MHIFTFGNNLRVVRTILGKILVLQDEGGSHGRNKEGTLSDMAVIRRTKLRDVTKTSMT